MSRSFLFSFLLFSSSLLAQELETIEVSANKDIARFTFGDSTEVSSDELESTPSGLISSEFEKVPGIISNQNGGPGGRVSFFIRGTESRHVAFTLDGLKINDTSNVDRQFDAAFMTSPFLREMTIHKGPQAVLYGSDAMGGVVELKTRKGENAPETRFILNGGSFGTVDATLSKDWKNKNNNGTLTVTRFHTDGISRLNEKRSDAKEQDAADITQLTSSSEHQWAPRFQTDFLASYIKSRSEFDGFNDDTSKNQSESDQYILQQKTNYALSKNSAISLRNGFNRHQRFVETKGQIDESYSGYLYQNELLHRLEVNDLGLLSGLSLEHEENKSLGIDRGLDLSSIFLQSSYKLNKLRIQAGVRNDHHSRFGNFLTGSGGLSLESGIQRFSLQYSQGFKAPSLYQLYAPDLGVPIGNRNLVPERNHSWEASWLLLTNTWEAEITFFQNRLSNLITFSNLGYMNQGSFIAEGIEVGTKWKGGNFLVAPSFTHQNFRKEEAPILRRPKNMAQVSLSYFPTETVELNATQRWFSSRYDMNLVGDTVKLNSYEVLDIGMRKTWEKDDVGLQIKNVLDRQYEDLYGYSVLPFSIFAHYGHKF